MIKDVPFYDQDSVSSFLLTHGHLVTRVKKDGEITILTIDDERKKEQPQSILISVLGSYQQKSRRK